MKIRLISDLHLEFGSLELTKGEEDILIAAGDIGINTSGMDWLKEIARAYYIPIITIAGNHEFYRTKQQCHHTWTSTIDNLAAAADSDEIEPGHVTFLEDSIATYKGVRFIGSTLWTDMKLYGDDPYILYQIQRGLNDFQVIKRQDKNKITPWDVMERHGVSRQFITETLKIPFAGKTVVISHHAPSWMSIADQFKSDKVSAAYASRLEPIILDYQPDLWVHGHTHLSFDYLIDKTRIVCNPRGYDKYELNPDFNPNLIIEV